MSGNEEAPARWTCEACGCHTNTEATDPVSCGVCGTNRMRMGAGGIPAGSYFQENCSNEFVDFLIYAI